MCPQTLLTPGRAILAQCLCQLPEGCGWGDNDGTLRECVLYTPKEGKATHSNAVLSTPQVNSESIFKLFAMQTWVLSCVGLLASLS